MITLVTLWMHLHYKKNDADLLYFGTFILDLVILNAIFYR